MVDHQGQAKRLTGLQRTPVGFGFIPAFISDGSGQADFHSDKDVAILFNTVNAALHTRQLQQIQFSGNRVISSQAAERPNRCRRC